MVLHDAPAPGELDAAGQRSAERAERLPVGPVGCTSRCAERPQPFDDQPSGGATATRSSGSAFEGVVGQRTDKLFQVVLSDEVRSSCAGRIDASGVQCGGEFIRAGWGRRDEE